VAPPVAATPLGFPLERHAGRLLPGARGLPRERTAEISRPIVARTYRQDSLQHRLVLLGLFREMHEEGLRLGIEAMVAAMEERLWRFLRDLGFHFLTGLARGAAAPPMALTGRGGSA